MYPIFGIQTVNHSSGRLSVCWPCTTFW